jgi:DNA-binding transcriptional regulator LsrR (DeoR family)
MVLLVGALYNFERFQTDVKKRLPAPEVARAHTRADLQEQARQLEADLIARYESGETVKALAREHGMHHQTVRRLLVAAGVEMRCKQRLSDDDLVEIRRAYQAGATTTELGDQLGVSATAIQRALKRMGIPRRPAARRPGTLRG